MLTRHRVLKQEKETFNDRNKMLFISLDQRMTSEAFKGDNIKTKSVSLQQRSSSHRENEENAIRGGNR
ncbi:Hypothetical predicted protein [Octopus vulgaris]|uniref:Uncharacterized protein n=1 Tax=Octopus vulgaris TaxID=6645 RepID=A0AA36FDB6_OCTVU|nr:Hypothetical predicted protein [Octopus vulgaris]